MRGAGRDVVAGDPVAERLIIDAGVGLGRDPGAETAIEVMCV